MRELRTEIEINASPEAIWAVLTDLGRYAEWNPFVIEAQGEVSEGTNLQVRIHLPGGRPMTFRPKVVQADAPRAFAWLGHLLFPGLFDGRHIYEIEASSGQASRFVQREEFRGLLVPLVWSKLSSNTRKGFEAMNEALKRRVEAKL